MAYKTVSTNDLSLVPEAVAKFEEIGTVVSVEQTRERVYAELADCDAYFTGCGVRIDDDFLDHAPNLKLIGSPHTGRDHLDLEAIEKRGITLFHIAEEYELLNSFTATSELTFGLLLSIVRKIPKAIETANSGRWAWENFIGFQLSKKTMGILGLGRLGAITARIALGFGMRVIAHDIRDVQAPGVDMVSLNTLLAQSDVFSIHIHLNEKTSGFMDGEKFSKMKPGAILLNTSRGRIVNEPDLLAALESGQLGGAGLDVIDGERLQPEELKNHPVISYAREHDNVVVVPHIGGSTMESLTGARIFMAQKMVDFMRSL